MSISLNKQSNSKKLEQKQSLIETKDSNRVIVIFFILAVGLLLSVIANVGLIYLSLHLGTKEKIYVARKGEIEIAEEKDPNFRSDKLIEETILNWLYLTHEWDSSVPGTQAKDPGVQLKSENSQYFRVPTKTYVASYLIEVGFRNKFLKNISQQIPSSFYQGRISSNLKVYYIGDIERIEDFLYRARIIFTRTEKSDTGEIQEVKMDQIIFLQAIKPYRLVLGKQEPSEFRKQLNNILKNGLVIYKVLPKAINK